MDGARFGDKDEQGSGDDGYLGVAFDQFAPSRYRWLIRRIGGRWSRIVLVFRVHLLWLLVHGAE